MLIKLKDHFKVTLRNFLSNTFIFRYFGKISVDINQRKILKLLRLNNQIFLKQVSPTFGKGGMDNYFHFIFDLLLPLNNLINKCEPDVIFYFEYLGNNTERLNNLFPGRIKILDKKEERKDIPKANIVGMNPKWVHSNNESVENFKKDICEKLGVRLSGKANKIVLVERIPIDNSVVSKAVSGVGGSAWRSIVNHEEFSSTLKSLVSSQFEFHNLRMEDYSFSEQIELFDSTALMIAQHGAALANSLWMRPGSVLIELRSYENRDHGYSICRMKHHNYYLYKTDSEHVVIDIEHFRRWILENTGLKQFFKDVGSQ